MPHANRARPLAAWVQGCALFRKREDGGMAGARSVVATTAFALLVLLSDTLVVNSGHVWQHGLLVGVVRRHKGLVVYLLRCAGE